MLDAAKLLKSSMTRIVSDVQNETLHELACGVRQEADEATQRLLGKPIVKLIGPCPVEIEGAVWTHYASQSALERLSRPDMASQILPPFLTLPPSGHPFWTWRRDALRKWIAKAARRRLSDARRRATSIIADAQAVMSAARAEKETAERIMAEAQLMEDQARNALREAHNAKNRAMDPPPAVLPVLAAPKAARKPIRSGAKKQAKRRSNNSKGA